MSSNPRVIAVAGGTGFVGGAIARELQSRGHRVIVLSHRASAAGGSPEYRTADATRPETLSGALEGVDTLVISLAFRNSPIEAPRRGQTFELVDAAGTEALTAAARAAGVGRLVYISGAGAAADAPKHWFRAKWRAEEAVRGSGIVYTIFRPSWVYGPGDHSLNRFLGMSRWLPFVPQIGNGRQLMAPVFVDDLGALVADALDTPAAANATLEVGGPETLTMDEIIRVGLRTLHRRRPILHAPVILMKIATAPLTLLPSPPMRPSAIDFIVQSAQVDREPLARCLPHRLTPLAEALATYLGRSEDR
jgi:NADH dehydrogenase